MRAPNTATYRHVLGAELLTGQVSSLYIPKCFYTVIILLSIVTREYFAQRSGHIPKSITIDDAVVRLYASLTEFASGGYFNMRFNLNKTDQNNTSDIMEGKLIQEFGLRSNKMIEFLNGNKHLDRDALFDLIEFLADNVAEPESGYYLYDDDCYISTTGTEPERLQIGLEKWRNAVNRYLVCLDPPFNLTIDKKIENKPPLEGLHSLMDSFVGGETNDQNKIKHACSLFQQHNATTDDKRSALKDLADVLEYIRDDVKKYIPSEENEIFNIANNYGIRHNNNCQIECNEEYMEWIFYSYLSAINLVTKLKRRL